MGIQQKVIDFELGMNPAVTDILATDIQSEVSLFPELA